MTVLRTHRTRDQDDGQAGQTLVEFALVIPMVILLLMALLELALAFNAFNGTNRASQNAAHLASIMGNQDGADCLILQEIEADISTPMSPSQIINVVIERTYAAGNPTGYEQKYDRDSSYALTCALPDGTDITLPYSQVASSYPEEQRCSVLRGCPDLTPARSTVDNIGVKVRYRHDWATPLSALIDALPGGNAGWAFTQRNIFRMEPTL